MRRVRASSRKRATWVGVDRFLRRGLHGGNLLRNLVGSLGGLAGQVLDLAGDHGEALAGVSSPGCLDGGVECQKVGLAGDVVEGAGLQQSHPMLVLTIDDLLDRHVLVSPCRLRITQDFARRRFQDRLEMLKGSL